MHSRSSRRRLGLSSLGSLAALGAAWDDIRAASRRGDPLRGLLPVRSIHSSIEGRVFRYELGLVDHAFHHIRSRTHRSMALHPVDRVTFAWLSPRGHHAIFELAGKVDVSSQGAVTVTGHAAIRSIVPNPDTPEGSPAKTAPGTKADTCPRGSMCMPYDDTTYECVILTLCGGGMGYRVCAVC